MQAEKLAEHNSRLQDELERCRAAASRVEVLKRENQRLAQDLEQALKERTSVQDRADDYGPGEVTPRPSIGPSPSSTRDESTLAQTVSWKKHQDLVAKFNLVSNNYKILKEVKTDLEVKREADKERFRKWNTFKEEQDAKVGKKEEKIQRLRETIQKLRAKLNDCAGDLEPSSSEEKTPAPQHHLDDIEIPRTSLSKVETTERTVESSYEEGEEEANLLPPIHHDNAYMSVDDTQFQDLEHRRSSSTEGSDHNLVHASEDEPSVKEEPLDDTPSSPNSIIVISSRSLRKRNGREKSTEPRSAFKIEDLGSSPLGLAAIYDLSDSIDLDDIGEKVDTPRKRKRARELSRRVPGFTSSPLSTLIRSQSISSEATQRTTPLGNKSVGRQGSVLQPRSVNKLILPRTSKDRAPKKRRIASDEAVGRLLEDGEISNSGVPTANLTPDARDRLGYLLAKPSPPKKILSPTRFSPSAHQVLSTNAYAPPRLAKEIQQKSPVKEFIAPCLSSFELKRQGNEVDSIRSSRESIGHIPEVTRTSSRSTPRTSAEPTRPSSRGKLNDSASTLRPLSNGSDYFSEPYAKAKEPSRLSEFFKHIHANMTPASKTNKESSPSSRPAPKTSLRDSAQPSATKKRYAYQNRNDSEELDVHPNHEPLRMRPIQSLTLNDFKVNPNYNQGVGHAYSEVVRGKDARKCLQGCTKPGCCGYKFRAFVEGMRDPNKPLTASQEEADRALLDEFMGGNAHKIQSMSKAEREEMLIQAKTREFANKYGKHRHAFERPSSPPGFWRAEFPTTQEEIEDKAKAREKERNTVEDRYKEAMRRGGRYMFRDE